MTPRPPVRTRQMVAVCTIVAVLLGGLFAVWAVTTNMIQTLQSANLTPEAEPATSLQPLSLLYAVKAPGQREVVVYRDDTADGTPTPVFRYTEPLAWDGRIVSSGKDPDCALSPDGGRLAYVDSDGLKVVDLDTGAVTPLVVKTSMKQRGDALVPEVPEWSSPALNTALRVYLLVRPVWSPDGSRIAVTAALYEGSRLVTVTVATRSLLFTTWQGLRYAWLPDSTAAIVVATPPSEVEDRLLAGNLTTGGLMQTIGGNPAIGNIKWPVVANDGRSLAFAGTGGLSITTPQGGQTLYLWQGAGQPRPIAELNARAIGAASDDTWPFFDSTGATLFWFDRPGAGDVVLNSVVLASNTRSAPLSLGPAAAARFLQWDTDGAALIAVYDATGEAQVLAVDPEAGAVQALGPPLPAFARVLGVAR